MGLFDLFFGNNDRYDAREKELDIRRTVDYWRRQNDDQFISYNAPTSKQQDRRSRIDSRLARIKNIPDVPGVVVKYMFVEEVALIVHMNLERVNEIELVDDVRAEGMIISEYGKRDYRYVNGEKTYL